MDELYTEISELWRLADEITIVDAALLLIDQEPQGISKYIESWDDHKMPTGYLAARSAIASAVSSSAVEGHLYQAYERDNGGFRYGEPYIDYGMSTVNLDSLKTWLRGKGFTQCFFFRNERLEGFRDPEHPRYAPKLAAAVAAWEAYEEDAFVAGTPKQRMEKWFRLNATGFGLVNEEGKLNETAISELAKICNWQTKGGAPKLIALEPGPSLEEPDFDEIPF